MLELLHCELHTIGAAGSIWAQLPPVHIQHACPLTNVGYAYPWPPVHPACTATQHPALKRDSPVQTLGKLWSSAEGAVDVLNEKACGCRFGQWRFWLNFAAYPIAPKRLHALISNC